MKHQYSNETLKNIWLLSSVLYCAICPYINLHNPVLRGFTYSILLFLGLIIVYLSTKIDGFYN